MQKQKCAKYDELYIFKKPLPRHVEIKHTKIFANIFLNKFLFKENGKCAKFFLKESAQKNYAKFLRKNRAIRFLLFKAFLRAIKSQNPMTGSRSKYKLKVKKTFRQYLQKRRNRFEVFESQDVSKFKK